MLLVGPQGQNIVVLGNTGGATDAVDADLTFDDAAACPILGAIVSGTYQRSAPGNLPASPSPAPANSGATALSTFNGTDPNGSWDLYAFDRVVLDAGAISGGWCLEVTSSSPPPGGAQPVPALGPVGLTLLCGLLGLGVFFGRRRG